MSRLLAGYRVVEVSALLNGAGTSMLLADLGADVVKVESPFLGDYIRVPATRHLHAQVNKNKRSLALDLRADEGRAVLHRLVAGADVFVTNVLSRSTGRLGIGYPQLRAVRPDLVYCQVTGYGAEGPLADIPTHGQMMDAMAGGIAAEVGRDGLARLRRPPALRSGSLSVAGEATAASAVYAALHVAAALAQRAASGQGCYLDVSAADAALASAWTAVVAQLNLPESQQWWTRPDAGRISARYQVYRTRDTRYIMFCPEERKFWDAFCDLVGRPDLSQAHNGYELRREIQKIIGARDLREWLDLAVAHRLPIGPVNDGMTQVQQDPQVRTREILHDGQTGTGEPFTYVGPPVRVAGQPYQVHSPAPALGADTHDILVELGYAADEIARLAERGITTAPGVDTNYIAEDIHDARH